MVMGQFVTTYRKDYLWPYVKTLGMKPEPDQLYRPQYTDPNACACHCLPQPAATAEQIKVIGPAAYDKEAWSRLGPMGPLLDPKLYPAKVSEAPESTIGRYNQPNVFLQKLEEKYPFIYECLRVAPPGDVLSRINKDRLSTTYQVDFCKKMEYPSAPYDELLRAAGVAGLAPCPPPKRLPGDVCRPLPKPAITKRMGGSTRCGGIPRVMDEANKAKYTPGSEGVKHVAPTKLRKAQESLRGKRVRPTAKEKVEYTCPIKPPGPYYRPYDIVDNFKIAEAYMTESKTCKPSSHTKEIIGWRPFDKENPVQNKLIDKWGQMVYRDTKHVHVDFCPSKSNHH